MKEVEKEGRTIITMQSVNTLLTILLLRRIIIEDKSSFH